MVTLRQLHYLAALAETLRRGYRPGEVVARDPELKAVLDLIRSGFFSPEDPELFHLRIDSTALALDTCVELIVAAAAARIRSATATPPGR